MMWKKLWNTLFHRKKTTEPKQSEEYKPMTAAAQESVCRQEEAPSKAPAEEEKPAPQAEQEEAPSKAHAEEEKPAPQAEQEEAPSKAPAEEEKPAPQAEQEEAPSEVPAEEEKPVPKAEKKARELTEEEKRRAYTPEQLKPELVEKLSKDPEYARMCIYCSNAPKLLTEKAKYLVPEHGRFEPCYVTFNHPMKIWDAIPFVAIGIDPVDGESKQALWVQIPFSLDSDRVMGKLMLTGTRQELIDYMNSPECGPQFMQFLDEINEALRNHD